MKKYILAALLFCFFLSALSTASYAQYEQSPLLANRMSKIYQKLDKPFSVLCSVKISCKDFMQVHAYKINYADAKNFKIEVVDLAESGATKVFVTRNGEHFKDGRKENSNYYESAINDLRMKIFNYTKVADNAEEYYITKSEPKDSDDYNIKNMKAMKNRYAGIFLIFLSIDKSNETVISIHQTASSLSDFPETITSTYEPPKNDLGIISGIDSMTKFKNWIFFASPEEVDLSDSPTVSEFDFEDLAQSYKNYLSTARPVLNNPASVTRKDKITIESEK